MLPGVFMYLALTATLRNLALTCDEETADI